MHTKFLFTYSILHLLTVCPTLSKLTSGLCKNEIQNKLELVFVVDRASRDILAKFPAVVKVIDKLAQEYPGSRFGISLFSDWPIDAWSGYGRSLQDDSNRKDDGRHHNDPEGCYTFHHKLSSDLNSVKRAAQSISYLPSGYGESSITALLFAIADKKLQWARSPPTSRSPRTKILVLLTDEKGHESKLPDKTHTRHDPIGDGTDTCAASNTATPEQTGNILKNNKGSVFALLSTAVHGDDIFQAWKGYGDKMKVNYEQANVNQDPDKISDQLRAFVDKINPVPRDVPCTEMPGSDFCKNEAKQKLDLVFVVDRSSRDTLNNLPAALSVVDMLLKEYPGSRFGMTLFSDYPDKDWVEKGRGVGPSPRADEGKPHKDPEGCYTFHLKLTPGSDAVKRAVSSIQYLPSGGPESSLTALLFTVGDTKVGWEEITFGSGVNLVKLMVIMTDEKGHRERLPDPSKRRWAPRGDGSDTCYWTNTPTLPLVGEILRKHNVALFGLLSTNNIGERIFVDWKDYGREMGVAYDHTHVRSDVTLIFEEIKRFVQKVSNFDEYATCADPPAYNTLGL